MKGEIIFGTHDSYTPKEMQIIALAGEINENDNLLNKGTITKDEYYVKREQLLKRKYEF